VPEQNEATVSKPALQDGPMHITDVGCCWQAPPPVQAPVLPQVPLAPQRACGSVTLTGTLAQLPRFPATLQALQVPHEPLEQQTPSTQLPLPHSWAAKQATPIPLTGRQLPPGALQ
jgi:hypothetical protein